MKAVLPGKPESRLQALATGFWDGRRITVRTELPLPSSSRPSRFALANVHSPQAYITGNAFAILSNPDTLLQTVYDDDDEPLVAIAFDEASGKIAACTPRVVRTYKPFGQQDDALKVGGFSLA